LAIPSPEPGLVLNYAYLWHDEFRAGREEGRKNRPTVIVLRTTQTQDQATLVTVLPITHAVPKNEREAVEIPQAIKKHLGLDDERSWIIITEGNEFTWPGFDLRKVPNKDVYDYGFLPPRFFNQLRDAFVEFARAGKMKSTPRS
jgi:PemK-like, MazF-like toxin of type II toxin-antitoxin system